MANLKHGMYATMSANDKVAYACGGIVVAGLLYLVVALIFKLVGVNRGYAFSAAGSNRTDHHLHWFISCAIGDPKCIDQLADRLCSIGGDHHL